MNFFADVLVNGGIFCVVLQIIDPSGSNVVLMGSKIEVNMRKAEPGSWPSLEMPSN